MFFCKEKIVSFALIIFMFFQCGCDLNSKKLADELQEMLQEINSLTEMGISYTEYQTKARQAKIEFDKLTNNKDIYNKFKKNKLSKLYAIFEHYEFCRRIWEQYYSSRNRSTREGFQIEGLESKKYVSLSIFNDDPLLKNIIERHSAIKQVFQSNIEISSFESWYSCQGILPQVWKIASDLLDELD